MSIDPPLSVPRIVSVCELVKAEGSDFRVYLFEYEYRGRRWSFEISAKSPEDAIARLQALTDATYVGVLEGSVPGRLGLFAKAYIWIRNQLRG